MEEIHCIEGPVELWMEDTVEGIKGSVGGH